jgi:hypothetical protein
MTMKRPPHDRTRRRFMTLAGSGFMLVSGTPETANPVCDACEGLEDSPSRAASAAVQERRA